MMNPMNINRKRPTPGPVFIIVLTYSIVFAAGGALA
jgi:hypothetical protein